MKTEYFAIQRLSLNLSEILIFGSLTSLPEDKPREIQAAFGVPQKFYYKYTPKRKYFKFIGFQYYMESLSPEQFPEFIERVHEMLTRCKLIHSSNQLLLP